MANLKIDYDEIVENSLTIQFKKKLGFDFASNVLKEGFSNLSDDVLQNVRSGGKFTVLVVSESKGKSLSIPSYRNENSTNPSGDIIASYGSDEGNYYVEIVVGHNEEKRVTLQKLESHLFSAIKNMIFKPAKEVDDAVQ